MPARYYESNWKALLMVFLTIICFFGLQEIRIINSDLSQMYSINQDAISSFNQFLSTNILLKASCDFLIKTYNLIYLKIFNIPLIFWLLILLNLFLAYHLRTPSLENLSLSLFSLQYLNSNNNTKTHYNNFRNFISSSYGAVSIAAISEIIILIKNYNTPGSIFWMCATITLLGLLQLCEIILNCEYVDNKSEKKSCFICVAQYLANKSSKSSKSNQRSIKIKKYIGMYGIMMIMISFFSATIFQIEQAANLFVESGGNYNHILITLGFGLCIVFFIASLKHFRVFFSINNKIVIPSVITYILFILLFLILNSSHLLNVIDLIISDITNPTAILPGVVSGLVISFARYIYKKYEPEEDENDLHSSAYEDTDVSKATTMYTIESFFMMFLVVISGIAFFMIQNYQDLYFFGLNTKYLILIFLGIFGFSIILNEAIYSKVALNHLIFLSDSMINWIIRIFLIIGVFMGLFPETDAWVDIADHISIIFLTINLVAFFFVKHDTKHSIEHYSLKRI